jgi:hypothetical protein
MRVWLLLLIFCAEFGVHEQEGGSLYNELYALEASANEEQLKK